MFTDIFLNKRQKQKMIKNLRGRNVIWRKDFASVIVDVEARPVAGILPSLLT